MSETFVKDYNDAHRNGVNIREAADALISAQQSDAERTMKRKEIADDLGDAVKLEADHLDRVAAWPKLSNAATRGLAGEISRVATAGSEADPVAVQISAMVAIGALMGRSRYLRISDTYHHARLMAALCGGTGKGRKGTSWGPVERLIGVAQEKIQSASTLPFPLGKPLKISPGPLSSGEGIVDIIRDKVGEDDEGGTDDKRLLVIESELAAALRSMQRNGNNLSTMLRCAWDGTSLSPLTKLKNRIVATNPHICIVAHVTTHELLALLNVGDIWGGFANRFLWICVRRRAIVPFPKPTPDADVDRLAGEIARVVRYQADRPTEMVLSNSAQDLWANVYTELQSTEHTGVLGACTSRSEAQTLRLALTFALLDGADRIEDHHVEAGLSLWRYADDSARYIFGGADADPIGAAILDALAHGPMTQNDLRDLFCRNVPAVRIAETLNDFQARGRVEMNVVKVQGQKGRPPKIWTRVG